MTILFPPALTLLLAAALTAVAPSKVRPWLVVAAPLFIVAQLEWWLPLHTEVELHWLTLSLTPLHVDEINQPWGDVFAILGVLGGLYSLHVRDRGQQVAVLVYGASAMGVVFAGDVISLMVAWEIMAVGSAYLVFAGGMRDSRRAGMRYLFVHIVGGSVLLAGVLWHIASTGSIALEPFDGSAASWLMLVGVAVNAAIPPLHAWLPDAYPNASVTGMVFMSGFTTKSAVYVLARGFVGWEVLLFLGVAMALYGMIFAVMESDIRRLLAYHIVSQVGFMVAGLGVGGEHALEAVASHAFTHVLYKGLLVMGAGAVLYATGRSHMSELGGLARRMRWVLALYMVGALSISAFPLFAGFVSKPLVTHVVKGEIEFMAFALYVASVGTFLHTGLKLPYFTFFGSRPQDPDAPDAVPVLRRIPMGMYAAMGIAAGLCVLIGVVPSWLFHQLHFEVHPERYTAANVVHTLELLAFTGLGFWALKHLLKPSTRILVDTDWFYRVAGPLVRVLVQTPLEAPFTATARLTRAVASRVSDAFLRPTATWTPVLRLTAYARARTPEAAVAWLARPPLGVAIAAAFIVFALVVLLAR